MVYNRFSTRHSLELTRLTTTDSPADCTLETVVSLSTGVVRTPAVHPNAESPLSPYANLDSGNVWVIGSASFNVRCTILPPFSHFIYIPLFPQSS